MEMRELRQVDLRGIVRFLGIAGEVDDDHAFPPTVIAGLRDLVPSDAVGFSELDRVDRLHLDDVWVGLDDVDASIHTYWRLRHEQPICWHQEVARDWRALKLSDFVTLRALRRREIYDAWFRPWKTRHQLVVGLDSPLTHTKVFIFIRSSGADFSERDRAVLDVLRPHLGALYRQAGERRRARRAFAAFDASGAPVVLVEHGDRIGFASPPALELLRRHFGTTDGRLPEQLVSAAPVSRIQTAEGTMVVHAVGETLVLQEYARELPLTPREREVLELVAEGMTNAEVGRALWVAPGTVRRHLENAFAKLGVHTRTAAVARLRHPPEAAG